jgi:hypothetical protein
VADGRAVGRKAAARLSLRRDDSLTTRRTPNGNANARYPGGLCAVVRERKLPIASRASDELAPNTSAWKPSTCTSQPPRKPWIRTSATNRRRSGIVNNIALNVNSNPTTTLIATDNPVA